MPQKPHTYHRVSWYSATEFSGFRPLLYIKGLFRVTPSAVSEKKNHVRNSSKLGMAIYSIFKDRDSSNI